MIHDTEHIWLRYLVSKINIELVVHIFATRVRTSITKLHGWMDGWMGGWVGGMADGWDDELRNQ